MHSKISFEDAQKLAPEGIDKLIEIRCNLDEVSHEYGQLYVEAHYEFLRDSQNRVWVITPLPEEPGCWMLDAGTEMLAW